jgi:hypothetical protein
MASVDRPSALDLAFLDLETVSLSAPGGAAELREVAGALLSGPLPPCAAGATCPPAWGPRPGQGAR